MLSDLMAMAKLEHPHCAAVLDVGMHDDKPYVVMDYITGTDLKALIDNGPVPIPRAVEIVKQTHGGRLAQVRVVLLLAVSAMTAIGVFHQPLWVPILTAIIPLSIIAFDLPHGLKRST